MSILSWCRRSPPAFEVRLMARIEELEEHNEALIRGNENLYLENKLFKSLIHRFYHKQPADG